MDNILTKRNETSNDVLNGKLEARHALAAKVSESYPSRNTTLAILCQMTARRKTSYTQQEISCSEFKKVE